ncbi:MAG: radical SAM protein [bacterium]
MSLSANISRKLSGRQIERRIGRIREILPILEERFSPCRLCPRSCGALRWDGELGECGVNGELQVASVARHKGEEPPVSGKSGAINVFFAGCNLHCIYCQNWPISQHRVGSIIPPEILAERILKKWRQGARTLGWVTPTPQLIKALEAYRLCLQAGFDLPLVYNCGGYESREVLQFLASVVDIWLPDVKTLDPEQARELHQIDDYPEVNWKALREMVRQEEQKLARAVIVRHLVLPGRLEDSKNILSKLYECFHDSIYLSLMVQYFPTYKTIEHPGLGRQLHSWEYQEIVNYTQGIGFKKGWMQNFEVENGIPLCCLS